MTSTSGVTAEEVTESVTGFDELAIEKHFDGFDIYTNGEDKPVRMLRALVFVHLRHTTEGKDADAAKTANSMTVAEVQAYFEEDNEANPSDPDTESGKGDSQHNSEPNASPGSAWQPESNPVSTPA